MHFINLHQNTEPRFDFKKFMNLEFTSYDVLSTVIFDKLLKLNPHGYHFVQGEEYKPDLVSFKIYGDTQYWWILLHYNGLVSYIDLREGMRLKYPSINDLESLYFELSSMAQQRRAR